MVEQTDQDTSNVERHLERDSGNKDSYKVETGMLTRENRKYLLGKKEFKNDNSRRVHESRIRKRIRYTLMDFELLHEPLGEELLMDVLSDILGNAKPGEGMGQDTELHNGIARLFGVFFDAMHLNADNPDLMQEYLEEGINLSLQERSDPSVYRDFRAKLYFNSSGRHDVRDVKDRFDEETLLSTDAIKYLIRVGEITEKEAEEYLNNLSAEQEKKMENFESEVGFPNLIEPWAVPEMESETDMMAFMGNLLKNSDSTDWVEDQSGENSAKRRVGETLVELKHRDVDFGKDEFIDEIERQWPEIVED